MKDDVRTSAPDDHRGVVPWYRSVRTRMMLWGALINAALVLLVAAASFYSAERIIVAGNESRIRRLADQQAEKLDAALRSVEVSALSVSNFVRAGASDRDYVIETLRAVVQADPDAAGGLVALEPGRIGADGFAYYVGRDGDPANDRDLAADGYPYRDKDWYRRTLAAPASWWSEPYFNETAGNVWMVTLNLPVRDPGVDAAAIGMVSLDVPIMRLTSLLYALLGQPGQRAALYAPEGTITVHPDPGVALNRTIADYVAEHARSDLAQVAEAQRERRRLEFDHTEPSSGDTRFTVFQPVGRSGWSLLLSVSQRQMLAELARANAWLLAGALLAIALCAYAQRKLAKRLTRPLAQLTDSAGHFSHGDYERPVPHADRGDEVGVLARAIDGARGSIKQQLAEIEQMSALRQKLESELAIARDIQRAMLPPGRVFDAADSHLEAFALLEPAKAVGGDFYTFFEREPGRLWFVIGDVSDKGVPAALFMARAVTVLEVAARLGGAPDTALVEASRRLVEGNDTCMFATVLCGVIDVRSGDYTLASAGHEAPVRVRRDGQVELVPVPSGPPLGFEPCDNFELWRGRLDPGELLLGYTDGVTEAFDPDNQAFGAERLLATLHAAAGSDAQAQSHGLLAKLHAFAAGAAQSDDITVLAIHRRHEADEDAGRG